MLIYYINNLIYKYLNVGSKLNVLQQGVHLFLVLGSEPGDFDLQCKYSTAGLHPTNNLQN